MVSEAALKQARSRMNLANPRDRRPSPDAYGLVQVG